MEAIGVAFVNNLPSIITAIITGGVGALLAWQAGKHAKEAGRQATTAVAATVANKADIQRVQESVSANTDLTESAKIETVKIAKSLNGGISHIIAEQVNKLGREIRELVSEHDAKDDERFSAIHADLLKYQKKLDAKDERAGPA